MKKCRQSLRKAPALLIAAALAWGGAAQGQAAGGTILYACPANGELIVQRNGSTAHVSLAGRRYDLLRKRSSIGDKYIAPKAALIIDGASAVFVSEDHLNLGTCTEAIPVASTP